MKTKYFYNAFNILYDLVKESLGIFKNEELYRQLFQAIYVMSGMLCMIMTQSVK